MGLYKRKNKDGTTTWYAQYFAHGRRYREAIGPSKRQADLVLGKRKAAVKLTATAIFATDVPSGVPHERTATA